MTDKQIRRDALWRLSYERTIIGLWDEIVDNQYDVDLPFIGDTEDLIAYCHGLTLSEIKGFANAIIYLINAEKRDRREQQIEYI